MCWFCLFQWVQEDSPTHATSTPVKIDSALQFVPKNTNPKEFKKLQQQVNVLLLCVYTCFATNSVEIISQEINCSIKFFWLHSSKK